jgi:two-component system sensor histidine kinase KdpD
MTRLRGVIARYLAPFIVVGATIAGLKLFPAVNELSAALLLILAVFFVAWVGESGPGIVAALLATLGLNFFFLPPLYTLTIADPRNVLSLVTFLAAAAVIGRLSALNRRRLRAIEAERRDLIRLTELSQAFLADTNRDALAGIAADRLRRALLCEEVTIELPGEDGRLKAFARAGEGEIRNDLCELAYRQGNSASLPSGTAGLDIYLPIPLGVTRIGVMAALGVRASERMAEACAALLGLALERERFLKMSREAEGAHARDEMKSTVLATLAHDLKTPLAAALGSVENWMSRGGQGREAELARESLERLSRLVDDLIAVVRLESGSMAPNREVVSMEEIAEAALSRFAESLGGHNLYVDVASPGGRVLVDPAQITEALGLGLENASRYSPPGTGIRLTSETRGGEAVLSVTDEGPGIPAADRERVFSKFVRLPGTEATPGTGLGLYIARNLVELNGGTLDLSSRERGGTRFEIRLPVSAA